MDGRGWFISANGYKILASIGNRAWIYRVVVGTNGGEVVKQVQDLIAVIPSANMVIAVWRITGE